VGSSGKREAVETYETGAIVKERIEELARECGIIGYEFINGKPVLEKISDREIRFFNEALEMAAKECEDISGNEPSGCGGRFGALDSAEAIRKLKV